MHYMAQQAVFGISVVFSFLAWGTIAVKYVWPALRRMPRAQAVRALLTVHAFRFEGLSFIVPGVVSPVLSLAFAGPAAYGDLATALLALVTLWVFPRNGWIPLAWIVNLWGVLDLLNATYHANGIGLARDPGLLGATFFIVTLFVPLLMVTHVLMIALLLQRSPNAAPLERPAGNLAP
jgi:hypothetical protein